jgi:hypothetical protein
MRGVGYDKRYTSTQELEGVQGEFDGHSTFFFASKLPTIIKSAGKKPFLGDVETSWEPNCPSFGEIIEQSRASHESVFQCSPTSSNLSI